MAKAAEADKPAHKMMKGSYGHLDYLVVARKGNMAFGVKAVAAMPGAKYGVPSATYFIVRVRCAPAGALFEDTDTGTNVVKLGQKFKAPHEAWPDIAWEKKSSDRASTILSMFVKGTLGAGPELENLLMENTKELAVGKKLTAMLVGLVGEENLVVKPRVITEYADGQVMVAINAVLEGLKKKQEAQQEMFAQLEDNFGVESAVLKGIYDKLGKKAPKDEDEDEGEDEVAGEECPEEHDDPDEI
jgi:hypothetical protein